MKNRKQPKVGKRGDEEFREPNEHEWKELVRTLQESIDWALDIAAKLAAPFPEEIEAIENVRTFVKARLVGRPAMVKIADLAITFAVLLTAIERDVLEHWRTALAPIRHVFGLKEAGLRAFRIPGAAELWETTMRHCPSAGPVLNRRTPHTRFGS